MMDMTNVTSNWAKLCDEYADDAYQLAHDLAEGLKETAEGNVTGGRPLHSL